MYSNYKQALCSGLSQESFRVVHLDLKGAPPRMSFLRQVLGLLVAHGCTALLIEYEDMFPYQGALANLSAKNAYTHEQVMVKRVGTTKKTSLQNPK